MTMQTKEFLAAQDIMAKISQDGSVEDMFEQLGATDERMDSMSYKESKFDRGVGYTEAADNKPRQMLLMALEWLMCEYSKPEKWFDAALLLDAYCSRQPDALKEQRLAVICAALANLLLKQDDVQFHAARCGLFTRTSYIIDCMMKAQNQGENHVDVTVSSTDLRIQEQLILNSIQWRLAMPTVSDWIGQLGIRMGVLTCSRYRPTTAPLWNYASHLAKVLVWKIPASNNFAPRRIAMGTILISCVATGLIAPGDLLAAEVDKDLVQRLTPLSLSLPFCPAVDRLPDRDLAIFLATLSVAARCSLVELIEDACIVGDALVASSLPLPACRSAAAEQASQSSGASET